eukprot:TRINITY_DN36350_c0_g1_i1.p1 TRINITY_DN36350_c0_g1~~TRINITY_DN36350_c0_g1_i1.p1  ORF type:complete len:422 (-),score=88.19 TRINITY_DN36350_c0_g1_i1:228-1469(-)
MLWAFSASGAASPKLFQAAASQLLGTKRSDLDLQELANVAWAFESANLATSELFAAFEQWFLSLMQADEVHRLDATKLAKLARDIKAVLLSLRAAGFLHPATVDLARQRLNKIGTAQEEISRQRHSLTANPKVSSDSDMEDLGEDKPRLVADYLDRCVVYKPPGWEVERNKEQQVSGRFQLWEFLQDSACQHCPICFDARSSFGFVHRLDVSSSGLILTAKTYSAYHDLDLQLQQGNIHRDYLVLCRGFMMTSRQLIDLRVHAARARAESRPSLVNTPAGRPSLTALKVLAHATLCGQAVSLLAVRIGSGRRHQIRAHLAHIGHPTVCDWLYSAGPSFSQDKVWCKRNFLHRQHLHFKDIDGSLQDVMSSVPADLLDALQLCVAKDSSSARALNVFQAGCAFSWDKYKALNQS